MKSELLSGAHLIAFRIVSKKISLPARIPFVVSADNFSIVPGANIQGLEASLGLEDIERGRSRDRGKDGKENTGSSGRERGTRGARAGSRARTTDASAPANNSPAGKSRTRTFSASPAGGTYYIYSFDGRLLAEYDLYGTCVRDYIYFGGQLIAEYDALGAQYYYYTSDQINSTRIVTNGAGVVVYAAAHDPYGGIQQTWPGNTFNPTPKFSGNERDGESQLDYFGARYYDSSIYRWISVDPAGSKPGAMNEPQRWNLYSYCRNNPLVFIDPDGSTEINIFLGIPVYKCKLDFNLLVTWAKEYGFEVKVLKPGKWTEKEFRESLEKKDTWTFYIGHSTRKDKNGKRHGVWFEERGFFDWVVSKNEYVGIFACGSADYAFDLFMAPVVFAISDMDPSDELGLSAAAYRMLQVLMLSNDPELATQQGTQFWAWALGWTEVQLEARGYAIVTQKK